MRQKAKYGQLNSEVLQQALLILAKGLSLLFVATNPWLDSAAELQLSSAAPQREPG